jgi:CRP/FNR family transcriptional regulator
MAGKPTPEEFTSVFNAFRESPESLVRAIIEAGALRAFDQGQLIYSPGDPCAGIGFFLSGETRVFRMGESGREITLYEIYPGETCMLNAACIFSRTGYPAEAVTLTDGEVLVLPEHVFRRHLSEHEAMRNFIFSLFSRRFATIMELVEEVAFGKMDKRLEDYLVEKAEAGELHATHQHIANELGTSREVVSRLLKDMERKGLLALSRNSIRFLKR